LFEDGNDAGGVGLDAGDAGGLNEIDVSMDQEPTVRIGLVQISEEILDVLFAGSALRGGLKQVADFFGGRDREGDMTHDGSPCIGLSWWTRRQRRQHYG
jgi:hypothetical protein